MAPRGHAAAPTVPAFAFAPGAQEEAVESVVCGVVCPDYISRAVQGPLLSLI